MQIQYYYYNYNPTCYELWKPILMQFHNEQPLLPSRFLNTPQQKCHKICNGKIGNTLSSNNMTSNTQEAFISEKAFFVIQKENSYLRDLCMVGALGQPEVVPQDQ